jgi:hypothetical protein
MNVYTNSINSSKYAGFYIVFDPVTLQVFKYLPIYLALRYLGPKFDKLLYTIKQLWQLLG